jgi:hypothetical protein
VMPPCNLPRTRRSFFSVVYMQYRPRTWQDWFQVPRGHRLCIDCTRTILGKDGDLKHPYCCFFVCKKLTYFREFKFYISEKSN